MKLLDQIDDSIINLNGLTFQIVGCRGEININPRLLMGPETQIRGVALTALWDLVEKNDDMNNTIDLLNQMAKANQLRPVLGKKYSLSDVQIAHREIIQCTGATGKVYFKM